MLLRTASLLQIMIRRCLITAALALKKTWIMMMKRSISRLSPRVVAEA
jgi:hypothetical protein